MLWLDPGLGKTAITLTTLGHLLKEKLLTGVLIVAPIKVIQMVWRQEAKKWAHTDHLTFSSIIGSRDQRCRALLKQADIYLINYENLQWLSETLNVFFVKNNRPLPFDGLVWDEINKMKNSGTRRVKAVKGILKHFKWTTGLTGTPTSNGYKDLHGQFLVVDGGHRLGTSKTAFSSKFYYSIPNTFKSVPYDNTETIIKELISDITLEMSAEDYNPLPNLMINDIELEFPQDLQEKYDQFEKEFFMQLDNDVNIEVFNKMALMNKCLQLSNGSVYPISGLPVWENVHSLKLEALERIIDEANGNQVLVAYQFKSDATRIMEHFKSIKPINLTACKTSSSLENAMTKWKKGECQLMIGHPQSMGHGIDGLQDNGHILVWFGLNWSLDLYEQFNARLRRQGQGIPVICHRIIMKGTLDYVQKATLGSKDESQASLRREIKNYRMEKWL